MSKRAPKQQHQCNLAFWARLKADPVRYAAHKAECNRRIQEYRRAFPDFKRWLVELGKARRIRVRTEVIAAYGGKCSCCGEREHIFLTLDHVNDDGANHRRQSGVATGDKIYRWAKRNGYPRTLRLLCYNCNCGRQINGGVCPHKIRHRCSSTTGRAVANS